MTTIQTASNPFALMMDPEAVFAALASSDRLSRLKSRVCRPLDKAQVAQPEGDDRPADDALDAVDDA
jgi:hypothetical protein